MEVKDNELKQEEYQKCVIAEDFVLPSLGKIYGKEFNPHIKLRSMTVRDEMRRLSQSATPHKNLCDIIDSCLLTKLPISCYDLSIKDYEFLLHKLRIVTYGPDYKMVVGCPHCNEVYEEVINLDDLRSIEFDLNAFVENQTFELPQSKKRISINFQTPRMLDSIDLKVKEFKKKNKTDLDPTPLITLQEVIDTIDGVKYSYIELENFINNLSQRDAIFILNKVTKLNSLLGLDTSIDVTCKSCGGDIKTFFRFGTEFFRPTNDE